jgi:hypothetical protein
MNMEERQHPLQAPQGTFEPPFPDLNNVSVPRSHSEKLPAGASANSREAFPCLFLITQLAYPQIVIV